MEEAFGGKVRAAGSADGVTIAYLDCPPDAATRPSQEPAPTVVLLHGFPHFHYTWHRQIPVLQEAGWRVLAPDMRGFGASSAPVGAQHYAPEPITGDIVAVLDDAGIGADEKVVLCGFDFGAAAAYDFCHLLPERVGAVIGFENPFVAALGDRPPSETFAEMADKHFFHMDYFQHPGRAEASMDAHVRTFLERVFWALSADYHYLDVWMHPPGTAYIDALPEAPPLPWPWLSVAEMDRYEREFARTGFTGPLQWYRAIDAQWAARKAFERATNPVPFYFLYSEHDPDLEGFHGREPLKKLDRFHDVVRAVRTVGRAGHLMHLEATADLNRELLWCLGDIRDAELLGGSGPR